MTVSSRLIEYPSSGRAFEGALYWDDSKTGPRPGILVAHTIRGRTAFEEQKAAALAEMGYCALAADVYGSDQIGNEAAGRQNMDALKADRPELQRRLHAALAALADQAEVDVACLAAIGYCFGGLCVLDLIRTRARVLGAVSFHGIFTRPGNTDGARTDASVLVLHGWDDPLATPDAVVGLGEELTSMGADWQIHAYGNTMHAFTNPAAADQQRGTVYQPSADRRSWRAMTDFLGDLFD